MDDETNKQPENQETQPQTQAAETYEQSPQTVLQDETQVSPQVATETTEQAQDLSSEKAIPGAASGSLTTLQKPRIHIFKIFVVISIIAIIVIYAIVGYLYFQNQQIKKDTTETISETEQLQDPPQPLPPSFNPEQIKIVNGSIVREIPGQEVEMLINKNDYTSTGITGFAKVVVSPSNTKICFESWPPAPEPALYIANIDGSGVSEISPNRQNCVWSSNSSTIFYLNTASKVSPVNIYQFSLNQGIEKNLTESSMPEEGIIRRFEIVGFSADEEKLICKYEDITDAGTNEGSCEIELETGEVTLV